MRRFLAPMAVAGTAAAAAVFTDPAAASAAPDLSAGAHSAVALAADPTFPPPRCVPENQTDGTFQWVYLKTRTLSGNGKSVKMLDFDFDRVPSAQEAPSVFPETVTCNAKPDRRPPAGPGPLRPPVGEAGSGLGL